MHHRVKSPPVAAGNSPSERWRSRCPQGRFTGFFCLFGLSHKMVQSTLGLQSAILSGVAAPSDSFRDILMEARRDSLPQQMTPEPVKQSAWLTQIKRRFAGELLVWLNMLGWTRFADLSRLTG